MFSVVNYLQLEKHRTLEFFASQSRERVKTSLSNTQSHKCKAGFQMDQACYMAELVNDFHDTNRETWNDQPTSQEIMALLTKAKKQKVGELSTITLAYVFQRKGSRKV